jgi:hypothetical protein
MALWNWRYTRSWLACQGFPWRRFRNSVDGAQLRLSFNDFQRECLWPGEVIRKLDWIRLKELTKSLDGEQVKWPAIPVRP